MRQISHPASDYFSRLFLGSASCFDLGRYADYPLNLDEISDVDAFISECESETSEFKVAGDHRIADWETGWSGLGIVGKKDGAPEEDLPFYFKKNTHIRIGDRVYRDRGGYGEFVLLRNLQYFVFSRLEDNLLSGAKAIVEYGCGTGHNLRFLKEFVPEIGFWGGCDWAQTAIDRVIERRIASSGYAFRVDYFEPKTFWAPKVPFIAFTNASLEQSGSRFTDFVNFLVNDEACLGGVHIEPVRELLGSTLLDKNAFQYAKKRQYLTNFLNYLECQPVRIIEAHNYGLGSKYISGYQVVQWAR